MIHYMLDTNIVSDIVRRPNGLVAAKVSQIGETCVCLSVITAAELRYGVSRNGFPRLVRAVDQVLGELTILPFETPAESHYADIRVALEKSRQSIGPNDLLIAAHARALDVTLVTANMREFMRVPNLTVENWLA